MFTWRWGWKITTSNWIGLVTCDPSPIPVIISAAELSTSSKMWTPVIITQLEYFKQTVLSWTNWLGNSGAKGKAYSVVNVSKSGYAQIPSQLWLDFSLKFNFLKSKVWWLILIWGDSQLLLFCTQSCFLKASNYSFLLLGCKLVF